MAAQKSGWANKKAAPGRALGIAAHRSFLTYVAAVVRWKYTAARSGFRAWISRWMPAA
jgi:hypothetical protein